MRTTEMKCLAIYGPSIINARGPGPWTPRCKWAVATASDAPNSTRFMVLLPLYLVACYASKVTWLYWIYPCRLNWRLIPSWPHMMCVRFCNTVVIAYPSTIHARQPCYVSFVPSIWGVSNVLYIRMVVEPGSDRIGQTYTLLVHLWRAWWSSGAYLHQWQRLRDLNF